MIEAFMGNCGENTACKLSFGEQVLPMETALKPVTPLLHAINVKGIFILSFCQDSEEPVGVRD